MANNNPECCSKPMTVQIEHRQVGGRVEHVNIWMCTVCGKTQVRVKDTTGFGLSALPLALHRARG